LIFFYIDCFNIIISGSCCLSIKSCFTCSRLV